MSTKILTKPIAWEHYQSLGEHYDKERPGYPDDVVQEIAKRTLALGSSSRRIVDVGCGTGIFTRMLSDALGETFEIRGLEPSSMMIQRALEATTTVRPIRFVQSPAERLPFGDRSVAVITAAGAAQLFDREQFYTEAHRVLVSEGLLALLQNKRRCEAGLFRSFEVFLEKFVPGYRTGTYADARGGHSAADFHAELTSDDRFSGVLLQKWDWPRQFTSEGFEAFALSTIQVKMARAERGDAAIMGELRSIISDHCDANGIIDVTYTTELTTAICGA
ncbi:class I SAM-dependent methyltransferase [Chelatococcus asaccharovorans]|uniref:Methyltransferase family protein n=1 Tax=Chelatococcus asaccharovorans TaxID=28210 RepID=A0A2V3U874_9HYPH|nr:class I SAM-dependent methyltransferase [Chelatococcus asaccharovorans]MBS7705582.1 class I SAM-dependent methyltransferase [Chelatococcus asaccharovorans]PXW60007.1 methyltransferase family protein [Chelatococcus asaccharovorans]